MSATGIILSIFSEMSGLYKAFMAGLASGILLYTLVFEANLLLRLAISYWFTKLAVGAFILDCISNFMNYFD